MPYHGKDIRTTPVYTAHKKGRYVVEPSGFLRGIEGDRVDLHAFLTNHSSSIEIVPISTKIMRVSGLLPGGFALIDQGKAASLGSIVFVRYNGQPVIRRLAKTPSGEWLLVADDPREKSLPINDETQIERIGVVVASIIRI
ncbi:MAG: S24 family peptidase [Chitinophagaceae bacterium]